MREMPWFILKQRRLHSSCVEVTHRFFLSVELQIHLDLSINLDIVAQSFRDLMNGIMVTTKFIPMRTIVYPNSLMQNIFAQESPNLD